MKLDKSLEEQLIKIIQEIFLEDNWDYQHSLAAGRVMKKIAHAEKEDERVLVTTMYLHDIGYAGSLKNNYNLADRIEAKTHHMEKGAEKANQILSKLGFSEKEIKKITYLISVHDKLNELKTKEELLVLEADSLAQIDPKVGNNFNEEEYARYVNIFEERRVPKFVTNQGKKLLKRFAKENKLFSKHTKLFKN